MLSPGQLDLSIRDGRLYLGGDWGQYLPADPMQGVQEMEIFRYILCAIYAVVGWEYFVTFHEERRRWNQLIVQRKFVPVNILVIIGRYLMVSNAITSAILFFGNPGNCQAPMTITFLTIFLVWVSLSPRSEPIPRPNPAAKAHCKAFNRQQLSSALIFVQRVRALYHRNPAVKFFIMGLTVFCTCLWIISLGFFYASRLPPQYVYPRMPSCVLAPSPPWRAMGFGGAILFDLAVLGLTVHRVRQQVKKEDRHLPTISGSSARRHNIKSARSWLIETAVIYGGVCLTINLATFLVIIFVHDNILAAYPIPFAAVINTLVSSRIVFRSDLWGAKTALLEARTLQGFVHPNHHRDGVLLSRNERSRASADGIGKGASTQTGGSDDLEMDKRSFRSSLRLLASPFPMQKSGFSMVDPFTPSGELSSSGKRRDQSGFAFSKSFSDFVLGSGDEESGRGRSSSFGGQNSVTPLGLRMHAPRASSSSSSRNSPFPRNNSSGPSSPYIDVSPTTTRDDALDRDGSYRGKGSIESEAIEDLEMQVHSSPLQRQRPALLRHNSLARSIEQDASASPRIIHVQREVSRSID